jgi:NADH dehydrogenase [ubiquinone] 1 alpha subcomplex assembly factor 5
MILFNPEIYALHHKRAQKTFCEHAFLFDHVGDELIERMKDIKQSFKKTLNLSPHSLGCYPHFSACPPRLHDDTWLTEGASFDLILSCLYAHWVNDFPGLLSNIRRCLRKEGLFLGALWGGNTLFELRESLLQAELSLTGGASPRIAPMLQISDAPLLLARAGFTNPVVDTERLTVTYGSLWSLMKDLRGMGETNKLSGRVKTFTPSRLFEKAEEIYQESFGEGDSTLPATFDVIYLTGWASAA